MLSVPDEGYSINESYALNLWDQPMYYVNNHQQRVDRVFMFHFKTVCDGWLFGIHINKPMFDLTIIYDYKWVLHDGRHVEGEPHKASDLTTEDQCCNVYRPIIT